MTAMDKYDRQRATVYRADQATPHHTTPRRQGPNVQLRIETFQLTGTDPPFPMRSKKLNINTKWEI